MPRPERPADDPPHVAVAREMGRAMVRAGLDLEQGYDALALLVGSLASAHAMEAGAPHLAPGLIDKLARSAKLYVADSSRGERMN